MAGSVTEDAETLVLPTPRDHRTAQDVPFHEYEEGLLKQQELFARTQVGAAFFGLLAAAAVAALIGAALSLAWTAVAARSVPWLDGIGWIVDANEQTMSAIGAVAGLLLLFVALFCGGYVAGRMARFNGSRQGVAVWVWAVVIAVGFGAVAMYTGQYVDVVSDVEQFALRLFIEEMLLVAAIVTATVVLGVSLTGAVLGGAAGMRYHRAVDRVWP